MRRSRPTRHRQPNDGSPTQDTRRPAPPDRHAGPAVSPAPPPRRRLEHWLYGRHTVAAALANPARRWRRLAVAAGLEDEAATLIGGALARRLGDGEALAVLDRPALTALLPPGAVHQGWALDAEPLAQPDLAALLDRLPADQRAVVVVLDQISDPHNVGAILRSAAAFGAAAVIVAEHGAPPPSAALAKAASGALDMVPLVRVVNLARTLDRLKEDGFWCCGLDAAGGDDLAALDLGPRVTLVLGAEGGGIRRLVREHCDRLARLPTLPALPSLNVSNAAAIALYELSRRTG